ncbi:MAG: septal ring lytic transglycosylase RlpA family protein [Treponema sp.]|jgi:rare lipoprotein A|nr:septal ring lytic transglycosylase RlpA family protein [Treponema sp.]
MKRITLFFSLALTVLVVRNAEAQTPQIPGGQTFRQEGIASWYGSEFDGRPTASGETFNSALLTAAHPTLPFGTMLTVTNKHNNKTVAVRVNDRGPFVSARIIDVSRAAAEQLDMIATGTAPVIVEGAEVPAEPAAAGQAADAGEKPAALSGIPDQAPQTASAPADRFPAETIRPAAELKHAAPLVSGRSYRLQVGAYKVARNAVEAFEKLKNAGLNPAYERHNDYFRVVLAGIRGEEMPLMAEKIGAAGFREALVRVER